MIIIGTLETVIFCKKRDATVKILKICTPKNIAIIILKFEQCDFTIE